MANTEFVLADIEKLKSFMEESEEAVREYGRIRKKFEEVNEKLLDKWKGQGADAYKLETDHIMENVMGIEEVLKGINEGVLKDIREYYEQLDEQLGEFNRNPQESEVE